MDDLREIQSFHLARQVATVGSVGFVRCESIVN